MESPHQSLDYSTPDEVYRTAYGGGASIVDKYSARKEIDQKQKTETKLRQRYFAACEELSS